MDDSSEDCGISIPSIELYFFPADGLIGERGESNVICCLGERFGRFGIRVDVILMSGAGIRIVGRGGSGGRATSRSY